MKIAVIGAGIAGLTAGRELAKAGHQVVVFEEKEELGGRMSTFRGGKNKDQLFDYGVPYINNASGEFGNLLNELSEKKLLKNWEGGYAKTGSDGKVYDTQNENPQLIATEGMSGIGNYLARMLDIRVGTKVGGMTHIGAHRTKKRTWMLNFPTSETENFDAVIIATSAREAYALLNTTIDEIETLTLVREIDEVNYAAKFTLLACYGNSEKPEWNALECNDEVISWVSNESAKRGDEAENDLVIHTTAEFTKENRNEEAEKVAEKITAHLADVVGGWAALPEWQKLHLWKYAEVNNPLPHDYMEIQNKETPLALIGGYMNGNDIESAYLSGLKLGKHWVEKYSEK